MITETDNLYASLMATKAAPDDLEQMISASAPAVQARLARIDRSFLRALLRHSRGDAAIPHAGAIIRHLATAPVAPVFLPEIAHSRTMALPVTGEIAGMPAFSNRAFDRWFHDQRVDYGLGLYGEKRRVYETDQFADSASTERRTIHMGIDVFAPAGTAVHAPIAGIVQSVVYNADPLDYGHTLILRHPFGEHSFFTLYGHLGASLPGLCQPGQTVAPGQIIAHLGDWHENGGWAPHLHFQIMTDLLDQTDGNFFGVGQESLWPVWQQICPDPNLILRLPPALFGR